MLGMLRRVGAAARCVGVALGTTNPVPLLLGSVASMLPDIDISTSPAGRLFPFISKPLERQFSHRSATHSLVASLVLGVITYGLWLYFRSLPLPW